MTILNNHLRVVKLSIVFNLITLYLPKKLLMSRIHVNIASNGWRKTQITEHAPAKGHAIKTSNASHMIENIKLLFPIFNFNYMLCTVRCLHTGIIRSAIC